jgi:hypothetical protein
MEVYQSIELINSVYANLEREACRELLKLVDPKATATTKKKIRSYLKTPFTLI